MIRTKSDKTNVTDIHPILRKFLEDMSYMFDGIVVTSGRDGKHSVWNSRHYLGLALDFGANSSNKTAYSNFKNYVFSNKEQLKQKYQIEDIIDEGTHIHVELVPTPKEKAIIYGSYGLIGVVAFYLSFLLYKHFKNK